jgi:hypothetical protein
MTDNTTSEHEWNHPIRGFEIGTFACAWQVRDLNEVTTRKLVVSLDAGGWGLRISPRHYLALRSRSKRNVFPNGLRRLWLAFRIGRRTIGWWPFDSKLNFTVNERTDQFAFGFLAGMDTDA